MILQGRTAMVTGAGQGVGRGIALALAVAGANVVVAARRAATGQPVADEIEGAGGHGLCVETDVGRREDVERAVAAAVETFGSLEIVVHNAFGGSPPHRIEDITPEMWKMNSTTAVWGAFHCARAAFPRLVEAGGRGRFIVITSAAGVEGSAALPLYAAVKGAQRALVKSLAREWGEHGVTANCIAPVADTPALRDAMASRPALAEWVRTRAVLGRIGDPTADVGPAAVFLASDGAGYITGQTVVCDGGSYFGL